MRSRFHTIGTSVKHSVCVRVEAGKPADGKYFLYESAPPTYPRGRWLLTGALSPVQLMREVSGQQQSKEGDTEQIVASTWSRVGGRRGPIMHPVLSNHQLIPERKCKDNPTHTGIHPQSQGIPNTVLAMPQEWFSSRLSLPCSWEGQHLGSCLLGLSDKYKTVHGLSHWSTHSGHVSSDVPV